ncbi:MAG: M23 family metallopeptidase [Archangium sp.]|nr:M23 family metallopeptidase [Archangium sp.]
MTLTCALLGIALSQAGAPSLGQGRALVKAMYDGDATRLWAEAGPGFRQQYGSPANLKAFTAKVERDFGRELRVIAEGLSARGQVTVYRRVAVFSHWARGVELELSLMSDGRLAGIAARPATKEAPTTYGKHRTRARLRLPFEGSWYVLWGGRSWQDNRHSAVPDMRYAIDLLQLTRAGSSSEGDGTRNEQYPAWAQPVLAAGDGEVVVADDGTADNEPNRPRGGNLYGNFVVIDHGTGEFSLVAHLMRGSLMVKRGDRVVAGQILGRTGNSGMSTEPHIHYQLMDRPDWREAHGFPAHFHDFMLNASVIQLGEVRRGDIIAPAAPVAARRAE